MTIVRDGTGRLPGPFGLTTPATGGVGTWTGNARGPIGYRPLFTGPGVAPAAATKTRTFGMPALPDHDKDPKQAHRVDWKLFERGGPKVTDVRQGGLANCPLASLLAAMANTPTGRKRIQELVVEHAEATITDLSEISGALTDEKETKISSPRYFTVKLTKETEVNDVFFTDTMDDRGNWSRLLYMQGSRSGTPVLWACVIEKAYAQMLGGYGTLEEQTLNAIWKTVMGRDPAGWVELNAKTNPDRIRDVAAKATVAPAVAASRDELPDEDSSVFADHGYAMLKLSGGKVELYNPYGTGLALTPADIRKYFEIIFHG